MFATRLTTLFTIARRGMATTTLPPYRADVYCSNTTATMRSLGSPRIVRGQTAIAFAQTTPLARQYRFKVALMGGSGVGKSSYITRCIASAFDSNIAPTYGLQVSTLHFYFPSFGLVTYNVWEIGGGEEFAHLYDVYLRDADAAIIMTDPTEESKRVQRLEQVHAWDLFTTDTPIVNVVNKMDYPTPSPVMLSIKQVRCLRNGEPIYISTKTGVNMDAPIWALTTALLPVGSNAYNHDFTYFTKRKMK